MVFPEDKLKLISKMIDDYFDYENVTYDAETLVCCIQSVIYYGEETSAE